MDFVFHIPYRKISDMQRRIDYVFGHVAEGVASVLRKYAVADPGVAEAVRAIAKRVRDDPEAYDLKEAERDWDE